jgi:multidrug efflux pump subunit AcrA (membrane-fusion protein)
MKRNIKKIQANIYIIIHRIYKTITRSIITHPAQSFFGVLGIFFLLIIIGSFIGKPKQSSNTAEQVSKQVEIHNIGSAPRIQMTAQVESSGVVKVVAQSSGIVQQLFVREGDRVYRGNNILWLSTNYQGGTAPTVARQIAQKNYDYITSTYDSQKNLIDRQRSIADSVQSQAGDLRAITNGSIGETQNLIDLDQSIVDTLSTQITQLEASNVGGANDALILQAKQGKAGATAGLNALKATLANATYQVDENNQPAHIVNAQHDVTIAQLDLQQKALDLNKEVSLLNLRIAQISEALMYPSSPVNGVVERVYVQLGQNVIQGTVIATITGDKKTSSVIVQVPESIAKAVSRLEPSTIVVGPERFDVPITYVSTQPTDGTLFSIIYRVPADKESLMVAGTSVRVSLPVGGDASTRAVPVIPIDAVYQTQTDSYVFTASPSATGVYTAQVVHVELGNTFGSSVEVLKGLSGDAHVITSRTVIQGDTVTIQK